MPQYQCPACASNRGGSYNEVNGHITYMKEDYIRSGQSFNRENWSNHQKVSGPILYTTASPAPALDGSPTFTDFAPVLPDEDNYVAPKTPTFTDFAPVLPDEESNVFTQTPITGGTDTGNSAGPATNTTMPPIDTRTQEEKNAAFTQAFSEAQAAAAAGDPTKLRNFDQWFGITRPEAEYGREFYSGSSLDERISLVNSMNISQDTKSKIILELQSGNTGPTVEMFVDWFGNGNPPSEGATALGSTTAGKIALTNALDISQEIKSKIILELQSGNTNPSVGDFVDWFSTGNPQSEGALIFASSPRDIPVTGTLQGTLDGSSTVSPVATAGATAERGAAEPVSNPTAVKSVTEMSNAEILDRLDELGFTMNPQNQGSFTHSSYTPEEVREITEIVGFINASTDQSLGQELSDRFVDFSAGSTSPPESSNANFSLDDMSADDIYRQMKEMGISMDASGNISNADGSFEGVNIESLAGGFGNLSQDQKDQLIALFANEADATAPAEGDVVPVLPDNQDGESAEQQSSDSPINPEAEGSENAGDAEASSDYSPEGLPDQANTSGDANRQDTVDGLRGSSGSITTNSDNTAAIDARKAAIQSRLDRIAAQRAPYGGSITDPRSDMVPPPIVGGASNSGLPSPQ